MATLVIDLQDKRPIWALPSEVRKQIESAAPVDWTVYFTRSPADGSGDGVHRAPQEVLDAVQDARVYMGYGIPPQILEAAPSLEWVHSGAAGVGSSLTPAMLESPVLFTNSAGIHGPPMAETAISMMLYFARGIDVALAAQREGRWGGADFWAADAPVSELAGSTVGIFGYGGVGREVGRRAAALGASVLAIRRSPVPAPEAEVLGPEGLERVLGASDYFVIAAPDTGETRGVLDRERLGVLKEGAVVINLARGKLIDAGALLEALDEGRLRGAGLDVFDPEPLPEGHPFYAHPRVLMTPHSSATTRRFWEREAELICDNVGRFSRGEPLRNLVDKIRGY